MALPQLREPLVGVGHRARSRHIKRFQLGYLKSCIGYELVHLAIEVTAAGEGLPERGEAILPADNGRVRRTAVLEKNEATAWFENTPHLLKRLGRMRDGTERPSDYDGVHGAIGKREGFVSRLREELNRKLFGTESLAGHALKFDRGVYPVDVLDLGRVKGQVQAGANADLEDLAACLEDPVPAQGGHFLVLHRQVDQPRQNVLSIKAHALYLYAGDRTDANRCLLSLRWFGVNSASFAGGQVSWLMDGEA